MVYLKCTNEKNHAALIYSQTSLVPKEKGNTAHYIKSALFPNLFIQK